MYWSGYGTWFTSFIYVDSIEGFKSITRLCYKNEAIEARRSPELKDRKNGTVKF